MSYNFPKYLFLKHFEHSQNIYVSVAFRIPISNQPHTYTHLHTHTHIHRARSPVPWLSGPLPAGVPTDFSYRDHSLWPALETQLWNRPELKAWAVPLQVGAVRGHSAQWPGGRAGRGRPALLQPVPPYALEARPPGCRAKQDSPGQTGSVWTSEGGRPHRRCHQEKGVCAGPF